MPEDHDHTEPKMKGYERVLNADPHRGQKIWDRGMNEEAWMHMVKYMARKMGIGPDPGPYTGPAVDFDKAKQQLDEEEPDMEDSRVQDLMQEWEEEKRRARDSNGPGQESLMIS
jgi:hypothetical protein